MDQTKAIDFEKLKQEELAKAAKAFIFKQVSREDLFNNLQVTFFFILREI